MKAKFALQKGSRTRGGREDTHHKAFENFKLHF